MGFAPVNHWQYLRKTMLNPEFWLTLGVFLTASCIAAAMVWLERRPKKDLNPSLFPTTFILLLSGAIVVLAGIHLLNLIGLHTGRP
jgi:hypothetical protein